MKRLAYLILAAMLATSCEKDEIGGTSTESLAGEWYVTALAVDADKEVTYGDVYRLGRFKLNTYNTAADDGKQIWVDDLKNFWQFKVKVDCDPAAQTFSTNGFVDNETYECQVKIEGGRVMYGAATTPHGTPADSIVFYVSFSDDNDAADYGIAGYKVSGYRYTGFYEDD